MDNLFYYIVKSRRQEQDKSPIVKYLEQISESKEAGQSNPYVKILDSRRAIMDRKKLDDDIKKAKAQAIAEDKKSKAEQDKALKETGEALAKEVEKNLQLFSRR